MKRLLFVLFCFVSTQINAQEIYGDTVTINGDKYVRVRDFKRFQDSIMALIMSSMTVRATPVFVQTAGTTVAATTTETSLTNTGVGSRTLAANYLKEGKVLRLIARGVFSAPVINLATLTCRFKFGSTTLVSGVTGTLLSGASNASFVAVVYLCVRSVGSSGTAILTGEIQHGNGLGGRAFAEMNNGTSTTTINTTVSNVLDFTAQFSNNNAGHTITCQFLEVESLN